MLDPADNSVLPTIPAKRYFTIGEVSELCQVKPHVLRYWEQEFSQLNPVKRRGNRRYYQRHEVELIRTIRSLLYLEGFTISGARHKLESDGEFEGAVVNTKTEVELPQVSRELIGGLINELEELTVMLRE